MFLPTKIYEALPAIYMAIGALLILGAAYIGNGPMLSYFAVGLSCVFAGVLVTSIRHKARSRPDGSEA